METTPTSKGASLKDCTTKRIDTSAFLLAEGEEESGRVSLGMASEHLLNVQEAFAGDDVVEAFEREKEEEVEKGRPKEVDLTLPGNTLSVELLFTEICGILVHRYCLLVVK